ncbi:recombinase family protein [Polaribacter pectinis]|uniref:Recombinase family protein n=1 Tax=Polaribacter pectinis TaxID=2738844 RepID=A0A7G9L8F4_9FLAO|nr:recombinase family protein [Polaribacter pectinis]QNM84903.1 recombinase family protein [Polaribacter pectinis]
MNPYKYILYARKSSEDKNRQVTSIEDQIKELKRIAIELDIQIVEIISESKSAKKPGREGFNKMLQKIHQGKADGILCWKLDRLARNPIDHGNIAWMLQQGIIQRIKTHSGEYKPSDNVLMMQVEFGMATQYVRDLRTNVRRGTRLKAERGWSPSPILPIGYKHNPLYLAKESNIEIIPDTKTYKKVKQLWEMLLTRAYSVADLKRHGDAIGLKSKKGNYLTLNTYHLLFKKTFYAGIFDWKNAEGSKSFYEGKHKKMITFPQYEEAQKILGNYHRPTRCRERNYTFPFRGIMSCGECSGYVTAEKIHQVICTNCKYKFSIKTNTQCRKCKTDFYEMKKPVEIIKKYYRCSKKKNKNCSQKSIEEEQIISYAGNFAETMKIDDRFYEWAKNEVLYLDSISEKESQVKELTKRQNELIKRLDGLINMRADGQIKNDVFITKSDEINKQLLRVKSELLHERDYKNNTRKVALKNLSLARNADEAFENADLKGKKNIIRELGYNLTLKDKSLSIITPKWINYLKEYVIEISAQNPWVQPKNKVDKYSSFRDFTPLNISLLAERDVK